MTTERVEHNETDIAEATAMSPGPAPQMPGPRGIGTAVAFDWGLTAQLLLDVPFLALGVGPGSNLTTAALGARLLAAAITTIFAATTFTLGEGVRRGRRLPWILQIVINSLLFLGGFSLIPGTIHSLSTGHFGGLVPQLILLVASPAAVLLLTRKPTRVWIAQTTSAQARARHGGSWPWKIAIWAIIGGVAVLLSGFF